MRWVSGVVLLAAVALTGCTESGRPPLLEDVDDQVAAVGQELVVNLRATDPDGDSIRYGFESTAEGIQRDGVVSVRPDGTAVFRWTPQGDDVGTWAIDFTASDGQHTDIVTAMIDVRSALGAGSAPLFRKPFGSGTGLDLERAPCIEVEVVVEDQDDAAVTLGQEAPVIEGATLTQLSGLTGSWEWCPSKAQLDEDRHRLVLSADDGDNEKTLKNFLIVLRQPPRPDCPGESPVVMHSPADISTVLDLEIRAEISDDMGLKNEPIVYYTFDPPSDPIDFSALSLVQMELSDGDFTRGTWVGRIPNPVSDSPEGTTQKVWYIIAAGDDDDATGSCDHVTEAPMGGMFEMTVTRSEGKGGAGLCEPCSANAQCGTAQDLCVVVGNLSESYCLQWCENNGDCEADYICADVQSFDGISAKQCVPSSNTCDGGPMGCTDDELEENDDQGSAAPLTPGAYNGLVACSADEDWYEVTVSGDTTIGAVLDGTSPNLNLGLYNASGLALSASNSAGSSEVVEECVPAGTYYWRVYGTSNGEPYDFLYDATPGSCTPAVCEDDSFEEDDSVAQSTAVDIDVGFAEVGRQICAGDADFHELQLTTTDTVVVDLTFEQTSADQDLDIHVFDDSGVDLTPCAPGNAGACDTANGQSGSANEQMTFSVNTAGTYHVVVMGFGDTVENDYDILITRQ